MPIGSCPLSERVSQLLYFKLCQVLSVFSVHLLQLHVWLLPEHQLDHYFPVCELPYRLLDLLQQS